MREVPSKGEQHNVQRGSNVSRVKSRERGPMSRNSKVESSHRGVPVNSEREMVCGVKAWTCRIAWCVRREGELPNGRR